MWLYILLAIIGTFANIIRKLAALEDAKNQFSLKVWWQKNKFKTLYGILASILSIFILKQMGELTEVTAILIGFTGDALLKSKLATFKTKTDNTTQSQSP